MLEQFINEMNNYFLSFENIELDKNLQKEIITSLNKEKLIIITGFYGSLKIKTISTIIKKTNFKDKKLYINKDFDTNNFLKEDKDLFGLVNFYNKNNDLKLIILENVNHIKNIKTAILDLYNKGIKIILLGNKIKLEGKKEIEVFAKRKNRFYYFADKGNLDFKTKMNIKHKTSFIIFDEIFNTYGIKNFELFKYCLVFFSKYNNLNSIRNVVKEVNKIVKISIVTFSEYLKYSRQAKILNQVFLYDCKKNIVSEIKSKFYFSDIDFRNSLANFTLPEKILKENFLFLELQKISYEIFLGKNGVYNFSFFARKNKEILMIDFCYTDDKKEFRKILNKLRKIENFKNYDIKKFLILENREELLIKKTNYENVEILSLNELLERIG